MAKIEEYKRETRVVEINGSPACIRVEHSVEDGDDNFEIHVYDVDDGSMFARNKDQGIVGLERSELQTVRDCINVMLGEVPKPVTPAPAATVDLKYATPVVLGQTVYINGREVSSDVLQKGDAFRFYADSDTTYRVVSDPFDGPAGKRGAWVAVVPRFNVTLADDDGEID